MVIVHIEHPVPDYGRWKAAFDGDPVDREESGVRRYRILRGIDDSNYVMIDLEFDGPGDAERFLATMQTVWSGVTGTIMSDPRVRIVEAVETKEY